MPDTCFQDFTDFRTWCENNWDAQQALAFGVETLEFLLRVEPDASRVENLPWHLEDPRAQEIAMPDLSCVRSLTVEAATTLVARFPDLCLPAITTLDRSIAAILARVTGRLELPGLRELEPELAKAFEGFRGHHLDLSGLGSLTPEAAKPLTTDASLERTLLLDGLNSLTPDTAAILGKLRGTLSLSGLQNLEVAAAKGLVQLDKRLCLNGLTALPPDLALALGRGGVQSLELNGLVQLNTPDLFGKRFQCLSLNGLRNLDANSARQLTKHGAVELQLGAVTRLEAEPAAQLANSVSVHLALPGLLDLPTEVAMALATFSGRSLDLGGLRELHLDAAKHLAQSQADTLDLCGVAHLDLPQAQALASYDGGKRLKRHHTGHLILNGLRDLSIEVAQAMARCKASTMELKGLEANARVALEYLRRDFKGMVEVS